MFEIRWGIWNYVEPEAEQCRDRRAKYKGYVFCELPVDHIVGRNTKPFFELAHAGRARNGAWHSWALDLTKYIDDIEQCRRLREAAGLPQDPPWWPNEAREIPRTDIK